MGPWLVEVGTREELQEWLEGRPPVTYRPVLMVIRGDSELIRELLPNALDAAKLDERRVVLWVKDEGLLPAATAAGLFGSDDEIVAAVLSEDRRLVGWMYRDQVGVDDAAFAFGTAAG